MIFVENPSFLTIFSGEGKSRENQAKTTTVDITPNKATIKPETTKNLNHFILEPNLENLRRFLASNVLAKSIEDKYTKVLNKSQFVFQPLDSLTVFIKFTSRRSIHTQIR